MLHFTEQNTFGFSKELLNVMNIELDQLLYENNVDLNDEQLVKYYSEKIFNKYC